MSCMLGGNRRSGSVLCNPRIVSGGCDRSQVWPPPRAGHPGHDDRKLVVGMGGKRLDILRVGSSASCSGGLDPDKTRIQLGPRDVAEDRQVV